MADNPKPPRPAPPLPPAAKRAAPLPLAKAPAKPPPPPPPPPSAPGGLDPGFLAEVELTSVRLGELDYFEVLKLAAQATPVEIKQAYYRESRAYHPDRFYSHPDQELRERVDRVYKRINEAYVVLRDDRKRARYALDIGGPNRAQKLRFTEESEVEAKVAAKKEREEEVGKTPQGRKFYEQGSKDFAAGKFTEAYRNFKMACTYEPANERYKEQMKEAEKNLPKGDFRIK